MTDQNCPQDGGIGDGFLDAEAMAHELTKRLQRLDEEAAQYSAAAGHLEDSRKSSDRLVEEVRGIIAQNTELQERVNGLSRLVNVVIGLVGLVGVVAVAALFAVLRSG